MTIGIYGIFDAKTNECLYVGMSSRSIEERWKKHQNLLASRKHRRKDFVEWYHANGAVIELLDFRVLEICERDNETLNISELKWFNKLKPKYFGKQPSLNEMWELSDETRKRIGMSAEKALSKLTYEKICKVCSNDFISRTHNACYCSEICRNSFYKSKNKNRIIKTKKQCRKCENIFFGSKTSSICLDCKNKNVLLAVVCSICKVSFQTKKINKIYCSENCHSKAFKQNNPDWKAPKSSRFEKMNKDDLNRLYTIENRSIDEICEFFGCKERTVYYHLKNFGIPKRFGKKPKSICLTCGVELAKRKSKHCLAHRNDGKNYDNLRRTKSDSFCLECGKKTFNKTASYCIDHKSIALRKGAHKQWHVNRGIVKEDCEFCVI